MAQDYRVYLLDDFGWAYTNTNKTKQLAICQAHEDVENAQNPFTGLIIFECRHHPEPIIKALKRTGMVWDSCYIQNLSGTQLDLFVGGWDEEVESP